MASTLIWNTDLVNETIQRYRQGADVDLGCFYLKNPELRAPNIAFQLTPKEEAEFIKCSTDIKYFVETYCKFLTDKGRQLVSLRDFQSDILCTLGDEVWLPSIEEFGPKVRNYILMASRQTGKTTTIAAYFSWYMCFHTDRNLAILANKQVTTIEIVDKVLQVFKGLPFFLKPGIISIGKLGMRLDNGCMLTSQATTKSAVLGFAIHVLYIDEFAHIQQSIAREFWRAVYPTLSSSLVSQCIISSTPNGMDNLFFEIWDKAIRGENSFVYKRVDYWEVPGHDEEWARKMKRDFGEEAFAQEFELKFDIKANNLLSANELLWIKKLSRLYKYTHRVLEKSQLDQELYENLRWRFDFDPNDDIDKKTRRFVISVDIAEGKDPDEKKDSDYNVAVIHEVKLKSLPKMKKLRRDQHRIENLFRMEQVGLYRDNEKDENVMAKVCKAIVFEQMDPEMFKLSVEMNFNGKAFLNEFSNHDDFEDSVVINTYHTTPVPGEKPPRKKPGYKVSANKEYFLKLGKRLIDERTLVPTEEETYYELNAFGRDKSGKFKGIDRHDDIAMSELNLSRVYSESEYADWLYDFLEELPDSPQKRYAMELLKEPYDETDVSDELFSAMYASHEENIINEIFEMNSMERMKFRPSASF